MGNKSKSQNHQKCIHCDSWLTESLGDEKYYCKNCNKSFQRGELMKRGEFKNNEVIKFEVKK